MSKGFDSLSRFDRTGIVLVLAAYFRGLGWWVERPTTGDFDLCLRRDREVMLLHCGHWDEESVPNNAVDEVQGMMTSTNASSAMLVSRGMFTPASCEAAARDGHIRLIDAAALRDMLGELPDTPAPGDPFAEAETITIEHVSGMAAAESLNVSTDPRSGARTGTRTRSLWRVFSMIGIIVFVLAMFVVFMR